MKKTATILAGIVMGAGSAQAQQQETQPEERPAEVFDESVDADREQRRTSEMEQQYDPQDEYNEPYTERKINPTPTEDRYDPRAGEAAGQEETRGAGMGEQEPPAGMTPASTADLPGKTIVTSQGEEVGTIEQVGYSRQHDERVVTVNVGGFLGVGDRIIAIPISELGLGGEGESVTTSLSRSALQQASEFDPSQLITAERARAPQIQN